MFYSLDLFDNRTLYFRLKRNCYYLWFDQTELVFDLEAYGIVNIIGVTEAVER